MVLVGGPAYDPGELRPSDGVIVRRYVPRLWEHFAASDLSIVVGRKTSTMELIALQRPFLSFPLEGHHEPQGLVALQRFAGLMTKDILGWMFMSKFIEAVFMRGSKIRSVQGKPCFQRVIDHCPFENGPSEFCYLPDYVVTNGVIGSLDLNLELLLDASMAEGVPVCVFTIINNAPRGDRGENALFDLQMSEIPREVLGSFAIQYIGEHWVIISQEIDYYEGREQVLITLQARLRKLGKSRAT
jgi:hypothetical protein